jgi:hypothetical protein
MTWLLVLAAVAIVACTRGVPGPPPPLTTTVVATNTHTAVPPPAATTPPLQPGPHSAIADIDLPAGTVPVVAGSASSESELWSYSAPYDDVVAFLQRQFATGRRYDAYGATWWKGLPPCYNDTKYNPADPAHESPPRGWVLDNGTTDWRWSDGAATLDVLVGPPQGGKILVSFFNEPLPTFTCNRA